MNRQRVFVARSLTYFVFGVLRAQTGAETAAEFRMLLSEAGMPPHDCDLWARLFETFSGGFHTAASEALISERRADFEAAARSLAQ